MVLRDLLKLCVTELVFFGKLFLPKYRENGLKIGFVNLMKILGHLCFFQFGL